MRLLVLYRTECPVTTALSAPCPASYPIPSPHLLLRSLHPTSPYLCPASVPLSQYSATSTTTSTSSIPPICTAADQYTKRTTVPHTSTVLYCTVQYRYWPRPASSAPALFILVLFILTLFVMQAISTLAGAPFQAMNGGLYNIM